jgi:cation-transporting ATPase E
MQSVAPPSARSGRHSPLAAAPAAGPSLAGLSSAEVTERVARGERNGPAPSTGRTYVAIIRENVFTFINNVLFILCFGLLALGEISDALVASGVVVGNVLVGVVQEVRAKRMLDRISVVTRPRATVVRDGVRSEIDPADIVRGDILVLDPGDQILVDGTLVGDGEIEVDESLLTGESDHVSKRDGIALYSGTFCVTGSALYRADKIGAESAARTLTVKARSFRRVLTPVQREVNVIVRVILLVAMLFEVFLLAETPLYYISLVDGVKMSVVIAKLVPAGLFLSIALAYAIGAIRVARSGALVQQVNAVESLSNVDVLCLDKTGTLTANQLKFEDVIPTGSSEVELRQVLGDVTASASTTNRTTEAIARAVPGRPQRSMEEVPFSSDRRWSGVSLDGPRLHGSYVLGAVEALRPASDLSAEIEAEATSRSNLGLRVLLLARSTADVRLHDESGRPRLPVTLTPLGLVSLSDELRPEARETLERFTAAGVTPKIISGDNPLTVAALATQAGLDPGPHVVSGAELAAMDEAQREQVAQAASIFGRIAPEQKEELVRLLRRRGHYVAMIGDGVNDVMSLKSANLGIAMETGSQAARAVADIVLLRDSFASLPSAVQEGQRIRNGIANVLKLFLTRVMAMSVLLMGVMILGGFPFGPKQISVLTTLTVGIPSIGLAAWAHSGQPARGAMIRSVIQFVLPAALTMALAGIGIYLYVLVVDYSDEMAQTALTVLAVLCGLVLLTFVEPPTRWLEGLDRTQGDWRPTLLAGGLFLVFVGILAIEPLRSFLGLVALPVRTYGVIGLTVVAWAIILSFAWRTRLLERFLGIDLQSSSRDDGSPRSALS